MPRLTNELARKAEVTGHDHVLWDDALTGFGLRITKAGAKRWIVAYRANGKARRESFGDPSVVDAPIARAHAKNILSRVALGADPWAERAAKEAGDAAAKTFREVCEAWIAHGTSHRRWRDNTISGVNQITRSVLLPRWGDRRIDAITRAEVKAMHREHGKTPGLANRALAWTSAIFTFAVDQEIVEANPALRIEKYPEEPRERVLSRDELRRLWAALRNEPKPWGPFFRLLILTGCRQSELWALRWDQCDLEVGTIQLAGRDTKGKKGRIVALSAPARAEISALPKSNEFVFGARLSRHAQRPAWDRVIAVAKIEGLHVHDLRRSKASFAINTGIDSAIVAKMIGDTKDVALSTYAHVLHDTVRAAEDRTQEALIAEAEREPAEVVAIRR